MKTLELKLKKDVLIVEIDNKCDITINKDGIYFYFLNGLVKCFKGNYNIICKGSELTEEIASELVEEHYMNGIRSYEIYNDYRYNDSRWLDDAKESFISAVESKEKFWLENPIEKPVNRDEYYKSEKVDSFEILLKEYQEYEEKTFKNPLIFVKK